MSAEAGGNISAVIGTGMGGYGTGNSNCPCQCPDKFWLPKQAEICLPEMVLEWAVTELETVTAHASAQINLRLRSRLKYVCCDWYWIWAVTELE